MAFAGCPGLPRTFHRFTSVHSRCCSIYALESLEVPSWAQELKNRRRLRLRNTTFDCSSGGEFFPEKNAIRRHQGWEVIYGTPDRLVVLLNIVLSSQDGTKHSEASNTADAMSH